MLAIAVFILFVVLLLLSVPISSTLSIVSLAPSILDPNFTISPEYIIRAMFGGIDSFPLLAVPMFVLSGILMAKGGVSKNYLMCFLSLLEKELPECHVLRLSHVYSMVLFQEVLLQQLQL